MEAPTKVPHPDLTIIHEMPNKQTLMVMRCELNANMKAMPTINNAPHGHLGIIMPDADYTLRNGGNPYITPVFPADPVLTGTFAEVEAIKLTYSRELKAHTYHTNAVEAARAQIIKAGPKQFLSVLATADMGLGDVLPLTMWTHLWNTYGTLTDDEAEANRQSLTAVICRCPS